MNLICYTSTLFFFFESITTAYADRPSTENTITDLSLPKADLLRNYLRKDLKYKKETVDVAVLMFYILQSFDPIDLNPDLFTFITTRDETRIFDSFFIYSFAYWIYREFVESLTPELHKTYNIPDDVSNHINPEKISLDNMDKYPVLRAFYDLFKKKFNSEFAKEVEQLKSLLNTNDHHKFNSILQTNDSVKFIVRDLKIKRFDNKIVLDEELEKSSKLIISRFEDEQDKNLLKKDVTFVIYFLRIEIKYKITLVKFAIIKAKRFLNHFKNEFCKKVEQNPSFLIPSTN